MKFRISDRTLLWSLLSGLLLALAFPRPDVAGLAWIALIPLLLVMEKRPFAAGFAAGLGFFSLVLYWLNIVMTTYGALHPALSLVAWLLLSAYLALYFGTATWLAWWLRKRLAMPIMLTLPVLWVALEFLRSFLLTGFPWASLGYSQHNVLPLIQSADLGGPYILGFLIVLVNAVLADRLRRWRGGERNLRSWLPTAAALLLWSSNVGYGQWRLAQPLDQRDTELETRLVQGNIDQSVKWDPVFAQATVDIYQQLSATPPGGTPADLIVWPESAVPFYYQDGGPLGRQVRTVAGREKVWLLFGSPAYEERHRQIRLLNSAFLLDSGEEILGRSDKVHLVPFGEYVPLGRYLPFIDKLVEGVGDFVPGELQPLPMNGHRVGVLVCYEAIFPELAREYVRRGSDLLVNITNDAWFGRSSAPYQHLAMARFRAVENRVWLARAANTGISAFIAPSGRLTQTTPLFETLAIQGRVGMGAHATVYTRLGDVFPALCLLLSALTLLRARLQRPQPAC